MTSCCSLVTLASRNHHHRHSHHPPPSLSLSPSIGFLGLAFSGFMGSGGGQGGVSSHIPITAPSAASSCPRRPPVARLLYPSLLRLWAWFLGFRVMGFSGKMEDREGLGCEQSRGRWERSSGMKHPRLFIFAINIAIIFIICFILFV